MRPGEMARREADFPTCWVRECQAHLHFTVVFRARSFEERHLPQPPQTANEILRISDTSEEMDQEVQSLRDQLAALQIAVAHKDTLLAQKEREKSAIIAENRAIVASKDRVIAERDATIAQLERQVNMRNC